MKKKLIALALTSTAALVGIGIIVSNASLLKVNGVEPSDDYTLTLDKNNAFDTSVGVANATRKRSTASAEINFEYLNLTHEGNNLDTFNALTSYLGNKAVGSTDSKIKGMKSITVTGVKDTTEASFGFKLSYGWTSGTYFVENYVVVGISDTTATFTFDDNTGYPSYFKIMPTYAGQEVNSVIVNYSCTEGTQPDHVAISNNYFVANEDGLTGAQFEDEPVVKTSNTKDGFKNLIVSKTPILDASYELSVKVKGTKAHPITEKVETGFIPYFKDESHFVAVYISWSATERPNGFRAVTVANTFTSPTSFVDAWGDATQWTDKFGVLSPDGDNVFSARVIKGETNTEVIIKLNGVDFTSVSFANQMGVSRYGFMADGDTVAFSDVTISAYTPTAGHNYAIGNAGVSTTFDYDAGAGTVTVVGKENWLSNLILTNDEGLTGAYTVSSTLTILSPDISLPMPADGNEYCQGIVPWYQDDNNFIILYTQFTNCTGGGMRKVGINGRIGGNDIGWAAEYWQDFSYNTDPNVAIELSCTNNGGVFTSYMNGTQLGVWDATTYQGGAFASANYSSSAKAGVWAFSKVGTSSVQFTDIIVL
ncbi:MAG: hypothetical protein HUJ59_00095 [Bacilli bacterium]|nr:hypothetical protein [Bacilli bacterium]